MIIHFDRTSYILKQQASPKVFSPYARQRSHVYHVVLLEYKAQNGSLFPKRFMKQVAHNKNIHNSVTWKWEFDNCTLLKLCMSDLPLVVLAGDNLWHVVSPDLIIVERLGTWKHTVMEADLRGGEACPLGMRISATGTGTG